MKRIALALLTLTLAACKTSDHERLTPLPVDSHGCPTISCTDYETGTVEQVCTITTEVCQIGVGNKTVCYFNLEHGCPRAF
jgi:hypothetical protein